MLNLVHFLMKCRQASWDLLYDRVITNLINLLLLTIGLVSYFLKKPVYLLLHFWKKSKIFVARGLTISKYFKIMRGKVVIPSQINIFKFLVFLSNILHWVPSQLIITSFIAFIGIVINITNVSLLNQFQLLKNFLMNRMNSE